jgi:hypothetical protein
MLLILTAIGSVYASSLSLTINQTKAGMQVHLYKVASVEDNAYVYTDQFKDASSTSVDLNNLKTSASLSSAATTLKGYALKTTGISQSANSSTLTFHNLSEGLYLVLVDPYTSDGVTYSYNPYLVAIPNTKEMNLTKYSSTQLYKYSLVKHWQGGTSTPDSVTVDIYNGSTIEKTVTLTKAKGYAYFWTSNEAKNYAIVEHPVDGYVSSVATSESDNTQSFVLTNTSLTTYNTPGTSSSTTSGGSTTPASEGSNESGNTTSKTYETSPNGNSTSTSTKSTSSSPVVSNKSVKTGDTTSIQTMVSLLVVAGIVLICVGRFLRN